jgi:SseB protein N-terminal domain
MHSGGPPDRAKAIVYVPAHAEVYEGAKKPAFEVRPRADGTQELPVFSSLERLVQALGRYQPWVALPLPELQRAASAVGVDRLTLDPADPPGTWRWSREKLGELGRKLTAAREGVTDGKG